VLGIVSGLFLQLSSRWSFLLRFRPVREVAEAARAGFPINVLTAAYRALDSALFPLFIAIVTLVGAAYAGAATGLENGATFGVALSLIGLSGSMAYGASAESSAAITDAAAGIVGMTLGQERPEVRGRLLVLDALGAATKGSVLSQHAVVAVLVAVIGASSLALEGARRADGLGVALTPGRFPTSIPVIVSVIASAMTVGWLGARAIGLVTRGARRVLEEVRRQLEGRDPSRTSTLGSVDHAPCVELASRFALRYSALPGFLATFALVLLALVLRLAQSEGKDSVTTDSVAAFVVAATIAGAFGTLVVGYAGGSLANAKKYILTGAHGGRLLTETASAEHPGRPRESLDSAGRESGRENPTYVAALTGDLLGDPLKDTAASVWLAFIRVLPALALVVQPFW
jgi:K(+)-stimulated pyrophosphate-energized sodium pump